MGVDKIGTRTDDGYGRVKSDYKAPTNRSVQIAADEYNRVADGLVAVEAAIGTTVDPAPGSIEERLGRALLGSDGKYLISNSAAAAALQITQTGTTSSSSSVGGAVTLNNTGNAGAGMVIYSANPSASGRLLSVRMNNATGASPCIYGENNGTSYTAKFTHSGETSTANCVLVESFNELDSSLGVTGYERGRGTIKITHSKPPSGASDANASAISIDLAGAGTAAQGLFIDSSGGTTGDLINARNSGADMFRVRSDGRTTCAGTISAAEPTLPGHLTTKAYVDSPKLVGVLHTGTAINLAAADAGKWNRTTGASPAITVRTNATHAIDDESFYSGKHEGTGDLTFTAASGVTIDAGTGYQAKVPTGGVWGLRKRATNTWDLMGERVPS